MPPIRVSARAKINLHLEVLGLRADGFHELAMLMQSLDLADELLLLRGFRWGVLAGLIGAGGAVYAALALALRAADPAELGGYLRRRRG